MQLIRARAAATGFTALLITISFLSSPTTSLAQTGSSSVESAVRSYFADVPVMAAIAKCESNFTQFNATGTALNGGSGGMMGVFQINKSVHAKFALSLGDDITTLQGNLAYARYLYNQEGTGPWDSSKDCWGDMPLPAAASSTPLAATDASTTVATALAVHAAATTTQKLVPAASKKLPTLSSNLKVGSVGAQVAVLQQYLNASGYKVAKEGPGSPGQETNKFGPATKLALQRFQCAQNIACSGTEGTTGYGFVGPKTRAALMLNL